MPDTPATSYDEVLYPGHAFAQTHPDRLAALGTLFGMDPAPLASCRVLELGCGDAGNLIPLAELFPDSRFVGIDLAPRAIAKGQENAQTLGLENVILYADDIRKVNADFGQFDYIIAHGLYSWVPPEIQDKVLAICHDNLAPQGVAYVSYNAFPGCRQHQMVREMLLYHIRAYERPDEQIGQALAFARFLKETHAKPEPYSVFLREELERVADHEDHLLYHDDLASINLPAYFHQFIDRAGRHGLQFLAEADFFEMQSHIYPDAVTAQLRRLAGGDVLKREQYLDFIKCRRFRQTLLCHAGVPLNRDLGGEQLTRFHIASAARPVAEKPDLGSYTEEQFQGPRGAGMTTDFPLAKAAIYYLGSVYPEALSFRDLAVRARSLLRQGPSANGEEGAEEENVLAEILLQTYAAGLIELYREPPQFTLKPGPRPMARPLARLQIHNGEAFVTSLRHANVNIEEPVARALILLLDGTRDRPALLADLTDMVTSGAAPLVVNNQPVTDPQEIGRMLASALEPNLVKLGRMALLVQ
jgi:methyltransferase-like protein/SAM-dependent methyltransferase